MYVCMYVCFLLVCAFYVHIFIVALLLVCPCIATGSNFVLVRLHKVNYLFQKLTRPPGFLFLIFFKI